MAKIMYISLDRYFVYYSYEHSISQLPNEEYLYNSYFLLFKYYKFSEVFIWSYLIYLYFLHHVLEYHMSELSFGYYALIPVMFLYVQI